VAHTLDLMVPEAISKKLEPMFIYQVRLSSLQLHSKVSRNCSLSFSTCYQGILDLEGAMNCILARTYHQRTTSEMRTKALLPTCPLLGGSTVGTMQPKDFSEFWRSHCISVPTTTVDTAKYET